MTATPCLAALLCFVTCLGTITPAALTGQTPAANAEAERVIPEVEFHHTPLPDVVASLRHEVPDANIVLQGGLENIRVSELKAAQRDGDASVARLALPPPPTLCCSPNHTSVLTEPK